MKMIPSQIEKDILTGRAQYKTFQTGVGGQSVLKVPDNARIVAFMYEFAPAGGGLTWLETFASSEDKTFIKTPDAINVFNVQQISFLSTSGFFPFVHKVNVSNFIAVGNQLKFEVNDAAFVRSVFIQSDKDVSITVGLVNRFQDRYVAKNIAVTDKTPTSLTFGGDGRPHAIRTPLAPNYRFYQPSVEKIGVDFYGTAAAPNADDNGKLLFTPPANVGFRGDGTPEIFEGLLDPSDYINEIFTNGGFDDFLIVPAAHYFLNVHYALYLDKL